MRFAMRFVVTLAALIGLGFGLSACNTLDGMGRDLQGAGEAMEETF